MKRRYAYNYRARTVVAETPGNIVLITSFTFDACNLGGGNSFALEYTSPAADGVKVALPVILSPYVLNEIEPALSQILSKPGRVNPEQPGF